MKLRRPEIFISATTADLGRARQAAKEALLTLGVHPVEQTNFPPDYRTIKEMLRKKIAECDAVIHIIGKIYGAEPRERTEWEARRSYTQLEYDVARELGKPLFTFIAGEDFLFEGVPDEDDEKSQLQQAHREAALQSDRVRYSFSGIEDLEKQIRGLQTRIEQLQKTIRRDRRHFAWIAGASLLLLLVIGWLIVELPQRLKPNHEYVIESQTPTPLAPRPAETTKEFSNIFVRGSAATRLLNGTPIRILNRVQVKIELLPPADWVEVEVVAGPDKGRRGWTLANRVKKIQ